VVWTLLIGVDNKHPVLFEWHFLNEKSILKATKFILSRTTTESLHLINRPRNTEYVTSSGRIELFRCVLKKKELSHKLRTNESNESTRRVCHFHQHWLFATYRAMLALTNSNPHHRSAPFPAWFQCLLPRRPLDRCCRYTNRRVLHKTTG